MIRIDVITVLPNFFQTPLESGLLRIARNKSLIDIQVHNLRDYGLGKYKQVDDTPFGGGAGMVLRVEPFFECIEALQKDRHYDEIIFLSPDGEVYDQTLANEFALKSNLMILCGHYKAIDERIRETFVTRTLSIGDYVLSGGEIPALVFMDSVARLLPGAMSDPESMLLDSFQNGVLDCAHYTRPAEYRGLKVPDDLLSGDHKKIQAWREKNSLERTKKNRPDLIKNS